VNFYSGNGDFSSGRFGIQGLSGDLLSWNQFLVHENSFRDAAFATLVGNFNENGTVTTKLISRWLGNATVDLALPTPHTPRASPTSVVRTEKDSCEEKKTITTYGAHFHVLKRKNVLFLDELRRTQSILMAKSPDPS
jgi:hypothetical protein